MAAEGPNTINITTMKAAPSALDDGPDQRSSLRRTDGTRIERSIHRTKLSTLSLAQERELDSKSRGDSTTAGRITFESSAKYGAPWSSSLEDNFVRRQG